MVSLLPCKTIEDQAGLSSHGYRVKPALLPTLCQYEQPAMCLKHCTQTFPGRSAATSAVPRAEKVCHDSSYKWANACMYTCMLWCSAHSCATRKISAGAAGSLSPVHKCYDDQTPTLEVKLPCLHMQCVRHLKFLQTLTALAQIQSNWSNDVANRIVS